MSRYYGVRKNGCVGVYDAPPGTACVYVQEPVGDFVRAIILRHRLVAFDAGVIVRVFAEDGAIDDQVVNAARVAIANAAKGVVSK